MDKNLQFLELKRMDPDVISPAKRKKNYKEIYGHYTSQIASAVSYTHLTLPTKRIV